MTTLIGLIIMFAIFSVVFNSKGFAFLAKGAAVLFIGGLCIIFVGSILPAILPFLIIIAVIGMIVGCVKK